MNFLAHLYITYPHSQWSLGNVIGDMIRPAEMGRLPAELIAGVDAHRIIDRESDNHKAFKNLLNALRARHRKYAPVVTDLLLDFVLARDWHDFDIPGSIEDFLDWAYAFMLESRDVVPEHVAGRLEMMARRRWFDSYLHPEGIRRVLGGMDGRARFPSRFSEANEDLELLDGMLKTALQQILPDVSRVVYAAHDYPNLRNAERS